MSSLASPQPEGKLPPISPRTVPHSDLGPPLGEPQEDASDAESEGDREGNKEDPILGQYMSFRLTKQSPAAQKAEEPKSPVLSDGGSESPHSPSDDRSPNAERARARQKKAVERRKTAQLEKELEKVREMEHTVISSSRALEGRVDRYSDVAARLQESWGAKEERLKRHTEDVLSENEERIQRGLRRQAEKEKRRHRKELRLIKESEGIRAKNTEKMQHAWLSHIEKDAEREKANTQARQLTSKRQADARERRRGEILKHGGLVDDRVEAKLMGALHHSDLVIQIEKDRLVKMQEALEVAWEKEEKARARQHEISLSRQQLVEANQRSLESVRERRELVEREREQKMRDLSSERKRALGTGRQKGRSRPWKAASHGQRRISIEGPISPSADATTSPKPVPQVPNMFSNSSFNFEWNEAEGMQAKED